MRRPEDQRLWFDKADGKTIYGVFPDQRFYSSEFEPASDLERDAIVATNEVLGIYSEWCKANYMERRAGRPQLPVPQALLDLVAPVLFEEVSDEPEISDAPEGS